MRLLNRIRCQQPEQVLFPRHDPNCEQSRWKFTDVCSCGLNTRRRYVPLHEDVRELQDCIEFIIWGKYNWPWSLYAMAVIEHVGQGRPEPRYELILTRVQALMKDIDLRRDEKEKRRLADLIQLEQLKAQYEVPQ